MLTGLTVVLGTSLMLFVVSLIVAICEDWITSHKKYERIVAEHFGQSGKQDTKRSFRKAVRRPTRVLGSTIL